jgi:formate C-acetyltransferase
MTDIFKTMLDDTVRTIRSLPVAIPNEGSILGFNQYHPDVTYDIRLHDNMHYPMGTTYLQYGVLGVAEKARNGIYMENDTEQNDFLSGIEIVYLEISEYFKRYIKPLQKQIKDADDQAEISRLNRMLRNVQAIVEGKPQTLTQAVQLFYFMWRIRCLDACACIGRLDVHLKPFYEADIQSGILTQDEALELICQLWNRINECGSGDTLINVMVGGQKEDGSDDSSDLSVLMLRASRIIKKTEPHVNVRYHKNIRGDVMEEAYKVQLMGHGQATIYNDEVVIPSLLEHGVSKKYAYKYTNDGCTEIMIDGGSTILFDHIDAVAVFELALNNGQLTPKNAEEIRYYHKNNAPVLYSPDVYTDFESGDTDEMVSFEEFYTAFLHQYRFQLEEKMQIMYNEHENQKNWHASYILNATFDTVLTLKKDIFSGGLPVDCFMTFLGSIPTVADCLMALKKVVFEKKQYTIKEVKQALAANFEGYAAMRCELLTAPKFGNDIDEVDTLSADIVKHACDWSDEFYKKTGFCVFPALVGWRFIEESYGVGATPDGRKYGDPIAEHYCATPGKAVNGPTALINSITKAPLYRAFGVAASHISLPAAVSENEENGIALLKALVMAGLDKGMVMINMAIYDVDSMKKAQCNPEQYQDLIARVWGFSAKFVDLSREMQDHIISRVLK